MTIIYTEFNAMSLMSLSFAIKGSFRLKNQTEDTTPVFLFFFITQGVRASLHAPRLILRPTEHPASPVGK
jgi:hypothetical protein